MHTFCYKVFKESKHMLLDTSGSVSMVCQSGCFGFLFLSKGAGEGQTNTKRQVEKKRRNSQRRGEDMGNEI